MIACSHFTCHACEDPVRRALEARIQYLEHVLETVRSSLAEATDMASADLPTALAAAVESLSCADCRQKRKSR